MDQNQFTKSCSLKTTSTTFSSSNARSEAPGSPTLLQVVTDGEEAISYLQGDGKYADRNVYPLPRLMVMDINMPRRSGFEVLEWVKGKSQPLRRMPIIIVSSSDSPADINRAYELGAERLHD